MGVIQIFVGVILIFVGVILIFVGVIQIFVGVIQIFLGVVVGLCVGLPATPSKNTDFLCFCTCPGVLLDIREGQPRPPSD